MYIGYVLEVYKVDSFVPETLLSSLMLTNIRLFFYEERNEKVFTTI